MSGPFEKDVVCSEWEEERNKHPFVVEHLSNSTIAKCWDDSANTYSGNEYSDIRKRIFSDLLTSGILKKDRTMLDIGCGPGLYEMLFHPHLKSIFCIDGSKKMLKRLIKECKDNDILNVSSELCAWETFDTDIKYDIVFSSLCPPLNNPESLLRMESYSSNTCIYISSVNSVSTLQREIWGRLGKNYSFKGYDTNYPYQYLLSIGRRPELRFYTEEYEAELNVKEAVSMQKRQLEKYHEITPDVENVIEHLVDSNSINNMIKDKKTLTLGLLVWDAECSR